MPRLNGRRRTSAPARCAIAVVSSVEPSSTTSTSKSGRWRRRPSITRPIVARSLYAGMTARWVDRLDTITKTHGARQGCDFSRAVRRITRETATTVCAVTADVSAIVVSYADPIAAAATARTLLEQSAPPLEVLVVDNGGEPGEPGTAWPPGVRALPPAGNVGYVLACNRAAAQARGRWLLFVNPDAPADRDCLARLHAAAEEDPDVAIVGAQVLLPGGERVNAGENPVHLTGLCWSGRFEQPRENGPARDVLAVSGAALMVRADVFAALGGFEPGYFMYHDDVDVCWRARLAGWRVRFVPEATVVHDYAFEKGAGKWFWLERNRAWTVLSNYGAGTLLLL